ncbi:unnamed protein product [Phytophthora lilii]|uniref:Unnamed protein product n=1 Tax=Phytophthora lilii TaxID=2077276 RepID=A0A9W7CMY1_9STRA|nr:unnamed protein product [Phytophthora lilii]
MDATAPKGTMQPWKWSNSHLITSILCSLSIWHTVRMPRRDWNRLSSRSVRRYRRLDHSPPCPGPESAGEGSVSGYDPFQILSSNATELKLHARLNSISTAESRKVVTASSNIASKTDLEVEDEMQNRPARALESYQQPAAYFTSGGEQDGEQDHHCNAEPDRLPV